MTDFEERFGPTVTMKLETTFRCPQSLCDISSAFIKKNPRQLNKVVRSQQPQLPDPVRIVQVDDELQIRSAISRRLDEITVMAGNGRKQKVLLLGRYQKDRDYLPQNYDGAHLELEFITVHSSKGLEGDHVLVPRMTSETLGFPSRVSDDRVLLLAMPGGDTFEFAEERRLFYVALTRARKTVTLITISHKESPFITELVKEHGLEVVDVNGEVSPSELCPSCETGFLVQRKGKYGPFMACSCFPKCKFTSNLKSESTTRTH